MVCIICGKTFIDDWRKDIRSKKTPLQFCSRSCANHRTLTDNTKAKISKALKGKESNNKGHYHKGTHASFTPKKDRKNILELSHRTIEKIMKRLNLPCSYPGCGWHVKGVVGDIHHIIPKKEGGSDDNSNLTYLCPNCHREIHSGVKDKTKLISIQDYIGDSWKEVYYTK